MVQIVTSSLAILKLSSGNDLILERVISYGDIAVTLSFIALGGVFLLTHTYEEIRSWFR